MFANKRNNRVYSNNWTPNGKIFQATNNLAVKRVKKMNREIEKWYKLFV